MSSKQSSKPRRVADLIERVPIAEVLTRLGIDVASGKLAAGGDGSKVRFPCPYHSGDGPNLEMRLLPSDDYAAGEHTCYVCGTTGTPGGAGAKPQRADFVKFYSRKTGLNRAQAIAELEKLYGAAQGLAPEVDRVFVGTAHAVLMRDDGLLEKLERLKGITRGTVARREIGYEPTSKRYTLPVADRNGRVINVRRYLLDRTDETKPKMLNMPGHGAAALYPYDNLVRPSLEFDRTALRDRARELVTAATPSDEPVVITEGEAKALILEQHGFRAVASTGGASVWNAALTAEFKERIVYICYDADAAGKAGAMKVANQLRRTAKWVGLVALPLDPKAGLKDVTDYFLSAGYEAQDFANLMLETPEYKPRGRKSIDEEYEGPPQQVSLRNAVKGQYSGKRIETEFLVASKDTSPYLVPMRVKVECARDMGEFCEQCAVLRRSKTQPTPEDHIFELAPADPALLRLINTRHENQERVLREIHGVARCPRSTLEPLETENVEFMKLVPTFDVSNPEAAEENCSRQGYRLGFGIEQNTAYRGEGFVMPDPLTQTAVLLFTSAHPAVDSLVEFKASVTDEELADLKCFAPVDQNDEEAIEAKLDELYNDLSMNVTGIYDRNDMHLFMDLCWHSLLYLPGHVFNKREPERGWCDMLVIGDTRQGKSETAARLRAHYGLSSWAPAKICTRAGLIGAAQQVGNRWHISWGVIPNADRQMVVIEEAKGMEREVIQQMTDVRSSGKAMIIMVESATTYARTRLLWLSNPRSDRSLDSYPFGVEAVKELIGAQEDISRFTAVMCVASGEVDEATLAGDRGARAVPKHEATAVRCRRLLLWTWTRGSDDVQLSDATVREIQRVVQDQSARYSPSIPLVEPADHRFKIARLAAALAARLYSTDETLRKLVVTPAHVRYVGRFLDGLYANRHFAYDAWSKIERAAREIRDEPRVRAAIVGTGSHWPEACTALLSLAEVTATDLEDLFGLDKDAARALMATLTQCQCLRRRKQARYRTPAFNSLLKAMLARVESSYAVEGDAALEQPRPRAAGLEGDSAF